MPQMSDLMFQIVARDQTRAAFDSAGKNAQAFAGQAATAGRRSEAGMKIASYEVANLAAQFSDIGVQLAGGQSPLLIALQQGSQIAPMFGRGGAAGAVALLGEAAMSLLNPFNLLTIAAIAGGGALLQMFTSGEKEADHSQETLKAFDDLVARIGKTSEASAAQIKKMLETPETWAALRADIAETGRSMQADLSAKVADLGKQMRDLHTEGFRAQFLQLGDPIAQAKERLAELGNELVAGKKSAHDVYDELTHMATAETTPPSLLQLIATLRAAALAASDVDAKLNALGTATKGGRVAPNNAEDLQKIIDNSDAVTNFNARLGGLDYDKLVTDLNQQAKALHAVAGGHEAAKTEAEKHAEAVQKVMQSLDDEMAKLHMSTTAQRELDELRKAGASAATAEGQAIIEKVRALEMEKAAQKAVAEQIEFAKTTSASFVTSFRQGMMSGQSAVESFKNAFSSMTDTILTKLEQMAVDKAFSSFFTPFTATTTLGGFIGAPAASPAAPPAVSAAAERLSRIPAQRPAAAEQSALDLNINLKSDMLEATVDSRIGRTVPPMFKKGWEGIKRTDLPDTVKSLAARSRRRG